MKPSSILVHTHTGPLQAQDTAPQISDAGKAGENAKRGQLSAAHVRAQVMVTPPLFGQAQETLKAQESRGDSPEVDAMATSQSTNTEQ